MKKDWTYKEFGAIVNFDKRFQGIDKSLQSSIVHFNHVSAEALKELSVPEGNVKLLSTGLFDGTTTEEKAGQNLNDGEVISIPTGGTPNIKYYKGKFVDSGNILCVAKDENICLRYVYYALRGNITQIANNFRGASILHPQMSKIWQIKLPIPPISIQESIVCELDAIHGILEKKQEQLRELDNLAQAIFYEMFGDPITNPKQWEVKKLGEVCVHITDGDHMPPPKSATGIPFITISNINKEDSSIDFKNTFFVPNSYFESIKATRKAQVGDILYTVTGSYGIPIIVSNNNPFCFQRHIALIRPDLEFVQSQYLASWLKSEGGIEQADMKATGIAQKTVSLSSLRTFSLPLPPLSLQQSFAAKIEAIEAQKQAVQQSIREVEALLAERMDNYFS